MTEPHPIYSDPTGPELMPPRPPDLVLGALSLWIEGPQGSGGWLDTVVYVGDHFETLMHTRGPLIKKSDLKAFAEALSGLAGRDSGEVILPSDGGSLGLRIKRYDGVMGGAYCEVAYRFYSGDLRLSVRCQRAQLGPAADGLRAALDRLARTRAMQWLPALLGGPPKVRERLARLVGPIGSKPAPDVPSQPPPPPAPEPPQGPDPVFEFTVESHGWHSLSVRVGDQLGEMGGSFIGDGLDHLLRAALQLAAGAAHAEILFNAEPGLTRLRFEAQYEYAGSPPDLPCRIRMTDESGFSAYEDGVELEAVCASGLAVAHAIYRMALPHFTDNDRADRLTFAAFEGALAAIEGAREDERVKLH